MTVISSLQERMPTGLVRRLPAFAVGSAWFFIFFSFAHLAWVIGMKWSDPAGLTTLYQTTAGEETYRAFGLAYHGTPGLALALLQTIVLLGATVGSLWRTDRIRRLGHLVLTAWAGLWMLNLMRLASLDVQLDSFCQALAMTVLFGATGTRALREWNHPARPSRRQYRQQVMDTAFPDQPVDEDHITSDHVTSGPALEEITDTIAPRDEDHPEAAPRRGRLATIRRLAATGARGTASVVGRLASGLASISTAFMSGVRAARSKSHRPTSA